MIAFKIQRYFGRIKYFETVFLNLNLIMDIKFGHSIIYDKEVEKKKYN